MKRQSLKTKKLNLEKLQISKLKAPHLIIAGNRLVSASVTNGDGDPGRCGETGGEAGED